MSTDFTKIEYLDLRFESRKGKLTPVLGRDPEILRLSRVVSKSIQNSAFVVAPSGSGKTSFLRAFALHLAAKPRAGNSIIVELEAGSLSRIGAIPQNLIGRYQEAFASIDEGVVIIDNFGGLTYGQTAAALNWAVLLKPLLKDAKVKFVLGMEPKEYEGLVKDQPTLLNFFESIKLTPLTVDQSLVILKQASKALVKQSITVTDEALKSIASFTQKFPVLGSLPKAGLMLLDECAAETASVTKTTVAKIVSEKTGIPLTQLSVDEKEKLKNLHTTLQLGVIGQGKALLTISSVIQRAKLGLKNSKRPLGSFLVLGPSGVGKTETAKILSQELYGSEQSFLRVDMSEFGEPHTVQRLIGSPPGYVGSDAGGQLTNHLKNHPYSLILLDEIEKAHPKIFDIFLQVLDDGRLTSGTGDIMDATQSTIIATSNIGVQNIIEQFLLGTDIHSPFFVKDTLMPHLLQHFRMEFLNRFDAIIVYKPLTQENLTDIALLEIGKIQDRVKEHNIQFTISREILEQNIISLADPRFGARPVKRFIEEVCEGLIAKELLK
jgi:ATP-dependent Clp protease ATP-binding subunit ClpC